MPVQMAVNARYKHRRVTGVERYAEEITIRLFPPTREIKPAFKLPPLLGHLWEQFILPLHLHSNEVLWSPANTAPWILRRQAVTIHDASVFDHPEWFKSTFGAWTRLSWRMLAKRAKAIITVSDFSCKRIQYHLGIPDERIYVFPNGVGLPFEPKPRKVIEEVRRKYNLTKPYFLFVGTYEPRKNLSTLIRAWEIFMSNNQLLDSGVDLVTAGMEGTVFAYVARVVNPTYSLGYVPDQDLPALYSGATAVVLPSLYEGSGLTALEAMACGTPVIASNTTSLPEIVGNAGIMVDPEKPKDIAEAMHRVSEDHALAETLREQGLKRAKQFTWDETAHKIQKLVESL